MIKKLIFGLLICAAMNSCGYAQKNDRQTTFTLEGKIIGQAKDSVNIYFEGIDGKNNLRSSAISKDGTFSCRGEIDGPTIAYVSMKRNESQRGDNPNQVTILLEPAKMTFTARLGAFKDAVVTGSRSQADLDELQKLKAPVDLEMKPVLDEYYAEKDHEKAAEIREKFEPFNLRKAKIDYDFFEKHPGSIVTVYQLRFHVSELSLDKLTYYYNHLTPEIRQSKYGKNIEEEIRKVSSGSPGSRAADFSKTDINGNPFSLSDLKGKYVVLDFWASWCVPCRKGMPHLMEMFNKYKDKGLEIICISDDDSKPELWKAAVAKDGTGAWHHVLRGLDRKKLLNKERNDNDISELYGIHVLPTKILIDRSGIIIGRYGGNGESEEALDKKLDELFDSK